MVARAWDDADYKSRLLSDANAALAELGYGGLQGDDMSMAGPRPAARLIAANREHRSVAASQRRSVAKRIPWEVAAEAPNDVNKVDRCRAPEFVGSSCRVERRSGSHSGYSFDRTDPVHWTRFGCRHSRP